MKAITFVAICIMLFSCKRCPPSGVEPKDISLRFSLINQDEDDLIFGENRIYDPDNVKFTILRGEDEFNASYYINIRDNCFDLCCFHTMEEHPIIIHAEFIPDKIDTIKIESHVTGWYEEKKGCPIFETYKHDVFFNNILVGADYSGDILKIKMQ